MTGANTTAYLLDYGVWKAHAAFATRIVRTIDCTESASGQPECVERDAAELCRQEAVAAGSRYRFWYFGHGTAVASLLTGGLTGAARPEIVSINLFNCSTSTAFTTARILAAALDWIKGDVQARKAAGTFMPSIVNHSGFVPPWSGESSIVINAGQQVVAEDVPYFTSADNFSGDSCAFTPNKNAYTPENRNGSFFVVGGTTMNGGEVNHRMTGTLDYAWKKAPSSQTGKGIQNSGTNLGDCVSAFAPAVFIHTAVNAHPVTLESDPSVANYYYDNHDAPGTSWSSPLAAGLALRWMAWQSPRATYREVYDFLLPGLVDPSNRKPLDYVEENDAYTVCYNPNDVNDWSWSPDANKTCTTAPQTSKYLMPAASNTSGARMLYYPYCN